MGGAVRLFIMAQNLTRNMIGSTEYELRLRLRWRWRWRWVEPPKLEASVARLDLYYQFVAILNLYSASVVRLDFYYTTTN